MPEISLDPLMAHLREFAKRIKLSGTTPELESFRYLQGVLDGYGYRTTLLSHDAFISLPGKARLEVGGAELRCITHSMSCSSPAEGVTATLVDVGDGSPAALAGRTLAGTIWLVDGIATPDVAARARAAGAVGQVHISPNEHLYEMCVSPVWGSPSQHTRDALPATVVTTVSNADGARLRAAGETTVRLWAEVDTGWRQTPLLVAEMGAPEEAADAPFVLLSGHHDTWHYGVMDNGGANATMLEAARVLAAGRERWRRGLRICFWSGHSHGRYSGSAWYADTRWDELDRLCAAHVNVDSTGGEGATVLTQSGVIPELRAVAAEAVREVSGQEHAGHRQGRNADQSFWGVGIPSMFGSVSHQKPGAEKMLAPLGWWWHTPHDLLERIDPAFLVRDTQIVLRVLELLLHADTIPLDYAATADALAAELTTLQAALGDRFDLADLIGLTHTLRERAAAPATDRALMRVARALVPLNHTRGDRFVHDPALPLPPWPALDGLRELARAEPDALNFCAVHARQSRNRVTHALRTAIEALDA